VTYCHVDYVVSSKKKGTGMKRLFGSLRYRVGGTGLLVAVLVLGAFVGTALAATLAGGNNNNTIIGTPNAPDTITDGNGNDIIFGLGGSTTQGDSIATGSGNSVIVADGQCTQGYDTVTAGYGAAAYCEVTQGNPKEARDTITTGGGANVIVGGAGPNTINAGVGTKGSDLIIGGQVGDTIKSSNGGNLIFLGSGSTYKGSTVNDGSGTSVIDAQNGVKDTITCAAGNNTTVFVDKNVDVVNGCAHVVTSKDPVSSYSLSSVKMPKRTAAAHTNKAKNAAGKHKHRSHKSR
jgi:Ca2+-binding RTX toxin-like protein